MNVEIERSKRKIDAIIIKIEELNNSEYNDFELISHLTKYLCVIISGYFEKSIYILLLNYSQDKSHENIKNYINTNLKKFTNANTDKIEKLLSTFNKEWGNQLRDINNYDELKASVNSVIGQRHQIAHGLDSTIGFVTLKNYYKNINKMINILQNEILCLS